MDGFKIGKIFGIEIAINPSWIFIFLIVTINLAIGIFPSLKPDWGIAFTWFMSIIASILFFVSVLAHEIAHSLVAKLKGLPVSRIILFLFGGVSNISREPASPGTEFLMAIVGPLTSVVLGFLFLFLSGIDFNQAVSAPTQFVATLTPVQTLLLWLGPINILLGIFNLIPGFPLDGGRLLRSLIWAITGNLSLATRIAVFLGEAIGFMFILTGISMAFGLPIPFLGTGVASGLWLALIGWFLSSAASRSLEEEESRVFLEGVPVRDLMRREITFIPPNLSISNLVDHYMIGTDRHVFPVVADHHLRGIVCLEDIQKIPRNEWGNKRVDQVMTPYSDMDVIHPTEDLEDALNKIAQKDIGQLPVVENGEVLGMVSRRDILLWLELKSNSENRRTDD